MFETTDSREDPGVFDVLCEDAASGRLLGSRRPSGARAPRVSWRRAARVSTKPLDGRANEELLITLRNEEQEHRAASGIGVVCSTPGFDSRELGSLGRRRAAGCPVGRRWSLGARAVGEAKCRCGGVGLSDHVGVQLAHRGTSERRRVRGEQSRRSGTVATGWVVRTLAPSFVRALSITRVVGLVSNGVLKSPE